ncbi:hypothetical protein C1H46_037780 [Malus baccata]|uniref:DUF4408 domain-containing protein n=1 Tax=Malus baccata TaxID=106549 RepID=A0A540KR68_MALBA|nr:hypothetical protein C1H46_037780 [Malus baccata]
MSTSSSNNWLLTLKVALISTGVVSMAVGLKLSSPLVADAVTSQVPSLWSSAISWLRPPYLYILINCIIISIVASSKLHPKPEDSHPETEPELVMVPPLTTEKISTQIQSDYAAYNGVILSEYGYDANVLPKISDSYGGVVLEEKVWVSEAVKKENREDRAAIDGGDENALVSTPVKTSLQRKGSMEFWLNENQKPPVSARIGHRKSVKASPEEHAASEVEGEQVGDVPGAEQRELAVTGSVVRVGAAEEGAVAESGRVEPASGGVHKKV